MQRKSTSSFVLVTALLAGLSAVVLLWLWGRYDNQAHASDLTLEDIPFDGRQAYKYLEEICELGPRWTGSPEMKKQQEMLQTHFEKLGGKVELQEFAFRHPVNGSNVRGANLIVRWHEDRKKRILLCAHYDTRPYPDQDSRNPQGVFIGANDGASGAALLMELGRQMPDFKSAYGVDFVLFDAEEFVFRATDKYFIGSEFFSTWYADQTRRRALGYKYEKGVLVDLIGDAELRLYQERRSLKYRGARPIVLDIWKTAKKLGVKEFVGQPRHEVRDDHIPLNEIAKIPTCDIIDFDYPYWHTEADLPDKCSALSLAKVGWVLHEWLKSLK
jgi:hypothetical protein